MRALLLIEMAAAATCAGVALAGEAQREGPFVIKLAIPAPTDSAGGIIVADVNNDGRMDYLVTVPGHLAVYRNDGTGGPEQLACAKERHREGDVCVFEPLTGKFVARFKERAARLYVADVTGDWREEIVVLSGSELHVYHNPEPNPRPNRKRLWTDRNYRRLKQCHNYYSP